MHECCSRMYVYVLHVSKCLWSQKSALGHLELALFVSHHVSSGNLSPQQDQEALLPNHRATCPAPI